MKKENFLSAKQRNHLTNDNPNSWDCMMQQMNTMHAELACW